MSNLTHLNERGEAHMVDVSAKEDSVREAVAAVEVDVGAELLRRIYEGDLPKGDVLATVRIAGIQAAKKTSELIPLCHPLPLHKVKVEIAKKDDSIIEITVTCRTSGKTGVEMEALTAASMAALTLYDMCKAVNKGIQINRLRLLEKQGGKSGHWRAGDAHSKVSA